MPARLNYLSLARTDYKDPPNLETNLKNLADNKKVSVYELLRDLDAYQRVGDGFCYGSHDRYMVTRHKHVRKTVGPRDYFRYPFTTSMDYGFLLADPALKEESWHKSRKNYMHVYSEMARYFEKGLMNDKFFKLLH